MTVAKISLVVHVHLPLLFGIRLVEKYERFGDLETSGWRDLNPAASTVQVVLYRMSYEVTLASLPQKTGRP